MGLLDLDKLRQDQREILLGAIEAELLAVATWQALRDADAAIERAEEAVADSERARLPSTDVVVTPELKTKVRR